MKSEELKTLFSPPKGGWGVILLCLLCIVSTTDAKKKKTSGNPIFEGWYADPEGAVLGGQYWVFPTFSAPYDEQLHFDAFSSKDLVNWTKHENVITKENIPWLRRALWAPAIIEANNKYYLFFGGNDVHEGEVGGIGVAVSDKPEGPYKDALGKPLINEIVNGAQPIDQFVFRDDDGQYYMFYGGWRHCNVCKLSPDLLSIVPWEDGQKFHEITPSKDYVEGPFMLKAEANTISCGAKADGRVLTIAWLTRLVTVLSAPLRSRARFCREMRVSLVEQVIIA